MEGSVSTPVPSLDIENIYQIPLAIPPIKNAAGFDAPIDGKPEWNLSNDTVLELLVADDGMTAIARTRGPVGSCTVVAEADADMEANDGETGAGIQRIHWTMQLNVLNAKAVGGALVAGPAELRPNLPTPPA